VGTFRGDLLIEGGLHSTTLDAGIFADVFDGDVIATGVIDNIITSGDFIGELDVFGSVGTLSVGGNWCLPACAQSGKLTVSVVEDDPQLATGIGSVFVQGDFPHGNEAVASVLTPVVGSWNTGRFRGGVATSLPDPRAGSVYF
jgi:hypothetical protein